MDKLKAMEREVKRAVLSGALPKQVEEAVSTSWQESSSLEEALVKSQASLQSLAEEARQARWAQAQRVLLVFTIVGASLDYALSEKNISDWIKTDRPSQWVIRGSVGMLAVTLSNAAERVFLERILLSTAKSGAEHMGVTLASRLVSGGVAGALFVVGEGLITAIYRDASWGELADRVYESVVVIAVCEGTVMAAELVIAGEIGAFGGPLGVGIAVGAGLVYEGVKYLWNSKGDLETYARSFQAKADVTRRKIDRWYERSVEAIRSTGVPADR